MNIIKNGMLNAHIFTQKSVPVLFETQPLMINEE